VGNSRIALAAVQRSRQRWLTGVISKFSTKSRAKNTQEIYQPVSATLSSLNLFISFFADVEEVQVHSVYQLGKCTVTVGPHVFLGTRILEVQWGENTRPGGERGGGDVPPSKPPKQPKSMGKKAVAAQAAQALAPRPATSTSTDPLIAQLNAVAANDPLLAEILRLAATKQASQAQLQALARYIHALQAEIDRRGASATPPTEAKDAPSSSTTTAPTPSTSLPSTSTAPPSTPQVGNAASPAPAPSTSPQTATSPSRPLLLVEFREASTERWSLPPSFSATLSKPPISSVSHDGEVIISFYLTSPPPAPPPSESKGKGKSSATAAAKANWGSPAPSHSAASAEPPHEFAYPVVMRLTDVSRNIWEGIERCVSAAESDPRTKEERDRFAELVPPRVYLQLRLQGAVEKVTHASCYTILYK
jgi:hypothetical protein